METLFKDIRYGIRSLLKQPGFTVITTITLALGIGANTAIYSFMDSILLRSLPVSDPASLVVVKWRSRPFSFSKESEFVVRSTDGRIDSDSTGTTAAIFPFPAFERMQEASAPVLSSIFAYHPAGNVNVMIKGAAELARGEYVSGDFFRGLAVSPAAGRLILADDDRAGAPEALDEQRVFSRNEVFVNRRSERRPDPFRGLEILVGDRQAVQRTGVAAANELLIGEACAFHRPIAHQRHDRVDDGVHALDLREVSADDLARGQFFRADQTRDLDRAHGANVVCHLSLRALRAWRSEGSPAR